MTATITIARSAPRSAEVVGYAVKSTGAVPRQITLNRAALEAHGFKGEVGQTLTLPGRDGATVVAVGIGTAPSLKQLRDAAAAFTRASGKFAHLATNLADQHATNPAGAAQAVAEGVLLATYRYVGQKNDTSSASTLATLTLVVDAKHEVAAKKGAERASIVAEAANRTREWANTPPSHLTARQFASHATALASTHGLSVEVYDKDQLAVMGCGGMLGVNAGSTEPPRVVKLTYTPRNPKAHIALVGKGVMYDSGGISLKPSDPMHALMKMDMSGAASVLSTMTTLKALGCRNKVTGYLMCTDNMPSGSALKLGDVLTMRNGKTVEIHNTDAEGRLILADGLSLAVEESPDAVIDICTLTGAAMGALGTEIAALLGSDSALIQRVKACAEGTDEPVWEMPLEKVRYRKLLDSVVADMRNIGGPYGGVITASIFLSEFTGDVPWAHLDIAGPMNVDGDSGWKSKGATGFGTRLLIDLVTNYTK